MVDKKPDWQEVSPPKKLRCTSSDCEHDLHCFKTNFRKKNRTSETFRNGRCVSCDADLIDWNRIDKRDLKDADYIVQAIQYELFRHVYWHKEIEENAKASAMKKGLNTLREEAERRISSALGRGVNENGWDGRQTPLKGNLIYYAQHGTATCCRKCAEEWHGIDRNHRLTPEEIKYMADMVILYIKKRLPTIPE